MIRFFFLLCPFSHSEASFRVWLLPWYDIETCNIFAQSFWLYWIRVYPLHWSWKPAAMHWTRFCQYVNVSLFSCKALASHHYIILWAYGLVLKNPLTCAWRADRWRGVEGSQYVYSVVWWPRLGPGCTTDTTHMLSPAGELTRVHQGKHASSSTQCCNGACTNADLSVLGEALA